VISAGGLVDAYRRLHPDEVGFTWWDYRQGHFHRKMGLRIDLVLVSEDLAARAQSCGIDRSFRKGPKPSDHAPLLLDVA
jgi:exodeoxyribonuclease-3